MTMWMYCGLFQHETELLEDSFIFPSFPALSNKFVSSEDEFVEAEDIVIQNRPGASRHPTLLDTKPVMIAAANHKQESRWRNTGNSWLQRLVKFMDLLSLWFLHDLSVYLFQTNKMMIAALPSFILTVASCHGIPCT